MKITREAFGYQSPKEPKDQFAQCKTCVRWTGERCMILGSDVEALAGDSCNEYIHGKPALDQAGKEKALMTPEEAGYVRRQVRCENCAYANPKDKTCGLYKALNKQNPSAFDLDENIDPKACCNAQTDKSENSITIAVHRNPGNKIEIKLKGK